MATLPTIHMNGTSAKALIDGYCKSAHAITIAIQVMKQHAPNARDYYVQGAGAYERAADEHMARMRKLQEVYDEFEQMANQLDAVRR